MEKFNNTNIFTGYLKQLLADFNLPKCRIYTKKYKQYFDAHGVESPEVIRTVIATDNQDGSKAYPNQLHYVPYIKEGKLQQLIRRQVGNDAYAEEWVDVGNRGNTQRHIHYYNRGMKMLNYTKNLQLRNDSYDYYTHEYLGDYLRFKRDYDDINLMPLYNCFSNRRCDKLKLELKYAYIVNGDEKSVKATFDTSDDTYKIYMLPVKLFQKYTIAIDCASQIELCCGLYGTYQDKREKFDRLMGLTYKKVAGSVFSQPFLYDRLLALAEDENKNLLAELAQNERDLKLFIKVPNDNTSTIVVLEGDYIGWNDCVNDADGKQTSNKAILNFEDLPIDLPFELNTPLQLLRFNTEEQHPFADRLVEYLTDNAITSDDVIANNIKRVQKAVMGVDSEYVPLAYGAWDGRLNQDIYAYMTAKYDSYDINHDMLGYVDKDVEKYYQYPEAVDAKAEPKVYYYVSIGNTELDERGR